MTALRETDLYPPVKRFLEAQGYSVKGEVGNCDIVAVREGDDPVVVELKTSFSLPLVFQGIQRQAITDDVYLAVPEQARGGRLWHKNQREIIKLCRRLGLGLMTVRTDESGLQTVAAHLDPGPYQPRKSRQRRGILLREFQRRVGDPNTGGTSKRPIVTAYRQDTLRCARYLDREGPTKASLVKAETGVSRAPQILLKDVYGWFYRVERGIYAVSPAGQNALGSYADVLETLGEGAA